MQVPSIVLGAVAMIGTVSGSSCASSCKSIGLAGPLVRIVVPAGWADGSSTFEVCADGECFGDLSPTPEGAGYVLTTLVPEARWGRTVRLLLSRNGPRGVSATGTIEPHAFYPGCVEVPVAAARYDSGANKLVASAYSFNNPTG